MRWFEWLLTKKVRWRWFAIAFGLGLVLSPILIPMARSIVHFMLDAGADGPGIFSLRPIFWLVLLASLAGNFVLVRRLLAVMKRVDELENLVERWEHAAPSTSPPPPPPRTPRMG